MARSPRRPSEEEKKAVTWNDLGRHVAFGVICGSARIGGVLANFPLSSYPASLAKRSHQRDSVRDCLLSFARARR